MKKNGVRRSALVCALALLFVWLAGAVPSHAEDAVEKKVTVMVYMTGSDLESGSMAATKDLEEMAASGVDLASVQLIVYTGGSPKWHNGLSTEVNTVLRLEEDGFHEVESFPRLSMGKAASLSRFLNYAYENYPAERFDLILWDHGNGPVMGYCLDRLYNNDTLTLAEMRTALEDSPFSEDNRLGILGFDACLMASAELICTLGGFADYMIASQEAEPNNGWNYAFLADCGKIPADELACRAVDDYLAFYESYYADKPFFNSEVTLAVVDLSYREQLYDAVCALFRKAAPDVTGQFNRLARSRVQTRSFGRATTGSEYDLVDLRCLTEELSAAYPTETKNLATLLDRMVIRAGSNTEQSCGVSLYFPFYNKNYYSSQWKDLYLDLNAFPEYLNFLYRFEQTWLATDMQGLFDAALNLRKGETEDRYELPLSPEQLDAVAEGRYYILRRTGENTYAPVYVGSGVEKTDTGLAATFDGQVIYYADRFAVRDILSLRLTDQLGTKTEYSVNSCVVESAPFYGEGSERKLCDVQLVADAADQSVEIRGIFEAEPDEAQSGGKKTEIDLDEWKLMLFVEMQTRFLTRAENGRILGLLDWPVEDSFYGEEIPLADQPYFLMAPLCEDGYSYYLMFEITDVQGNCVCSEPFALELAPPHAAAESAVHGVSWGDESCAELELSGIRFRFRFGWDLENREPMCWVDAENGNEFPVSLSLNDSAVDAVRGEPYGIYFQLEPGQAESRFFPSVSNLMKQLGGADRIRFRVSACNGENFGTLLQNEMIELSGTRLTDGESFREPFLGAAADEQLIYSDGALEVRLLGLGFYVSPMARDPEAGDAELTAWYRIDNLSDEAHSLAIPALSLNGASLTTSVVPFSDIVPLQAHNSFYFKQTLSRRVLDWMNAPFALAAGENGDLPIRSISAVSALLVIDDRGCWCPVALKTSGVGETVSAAGNLIYEDENWRIWRERREGQEPDELCLWVENLTEQAQFFCLDAGERSFASGVIGPHALQFVGARLPAEIRAGEDATLRYYSWKDARESFPAEPEPQRTAFFSLDAVDQGGQA